MRIGIVVGMVAEAERALAPAASLPEPLRPLIFIAGGCAGRAYRGACELLRAGASALLSFGVAGGLDPALETGDAVLASEVVLPDGAHLESDPRWQRSLTVALAGRARVGGIAGRDMMVATRAGKETLASRTGAVAVDMESHEVARAAAEAGVPFMALRVILDPLGGQLPWAALVGLAPDGRRRALPVLARLLLRPWELPRLIALARDDRRALAALGRLAADLGPAFGFLV